MTPLDLIHDLQWGDLPADVRERAELCLLDLIGVAAGGHGTRLSAIVRAYAGEAFAGASPMLFDARTASAAGVALAAGMTIDALDGHDGFNPAKGHIGCPLFAAALALGHLHGVGGREFLTAIAMGYEFGARASAAQHGTVADYHSSGSWGAVTAAAAGARLAGLDRERTRHALGIAEYHGPRSQMMRCIDHPGMVKDGSGWGAMAGATAVQLAARGFTGAPAITVEDAPGYWDDLGERWCVLEQYFKPYPVCRWAQAPIEAVLALARRHDLKAARVARIEIETFHEAVRLTANRPRTTEEAQYSTSFPCAVALVRGTVTPADIAEGALDDPEILRLSLSLEMRESGRANAAFPAQRLARARLTLSDGTRLEGGWTGPRWEHGEPPTGAELRAKYHALADPVLGQTRAGAIEDALARLGTGTLAALGDLLFQPISRATTPGRSA